MAQITTGIRAALSLPFIYSAFQSLMGAHKVSVMFVNDFVKLVPGMKILDIGCGPAAILEYLPGVEYYGFDISETYIAKAKQKYGNRGIFRCKQLTQADLATLPSFDVVLALGLIHHLGDAQANHILQLATAALKPGGRLLTMDPCPEPTQNIVANLLIRLDRGQNVRGSMGYASLAKKVFEAPRVEIRHQTWIPYTRCFMECTK